ncbi:MAG TPA: transposase [Acidimicrobiales bacterium]|nr:transposase [Acidimicrobiales bacterium]
MARCRTFRYLLQPTSRQKAALALLLRLQCELYNAALEERRGAWRWGRRSISYIDQTKTLTALREVRPEVLASGVTVCRGTLQRLDRAFSAFYRRCREGQRPGYPRFKSARRFDSLQWEDRSGWRLDEEARRLWLLGIGHVKVRQHRSLRGVPKAITVKREGRRWFVSVRCTEVPARPLPPTGKEVGIDLGICALVATSDGELVTEGRFAKRAAGKLACAQRAFSQKRRGSKRRERAAVAVGRAHRKIANQRRDLHHQLSRRLVDAYDFIVVEDLRIAQMVRRPRPRPDGTGGFLGASAKRGLNRSICDAGWGQLVAFLGYKAEEAGRQVLVINPRYSSLTCSSCGHRAQGNRLTQAVFSCQACGHGAHADVNAAVNILRAGRARQASACEGSGN